VLLAKWSTLLKRVTSPAWPIILAAFGKVARTVRRASRSYIRRIWPGRYRQRWREDGFPSVESFGPWALDAYSGPTQPDRHSVALRRLSDRSIAPNLAVLLGEGPVTLANVSAPLRAAVVSRADGSASEASVVTGVAAVMMRHVVASNCISL
jgi:hypothetical protein